MDFEWASFHIEHSATLRLLRDKHAPLILSFFFFAFKSKNRLQMPYVELHSLLVQFLDSLNEEARQSFTLSPQKLLDVWSDDQHAFIRKYFELNQDEPMTELTADTERAIEWMQSLEKKEFVGTQSRFLSIYDVTTHPFNENFFKIIKKVLDRVFCANFSQNKGCLFFLNTRPLQSIALQ